MLHKNYKLLFVLSVEDKVAKNIYLQQMRAHCIIAMIVVAFEKQEN